VGPASGKTQHGEATMARAAAQYFLVEGHRDNFELTARRRKGDRCPLAAWLPRLRRAGMNLSIIAVGGDGIHHRDGSDRPLVGSLDVLDMFVNDVETLRARGEPVEVVLAREDLPARPDDGVVRFVLEIEGGRPFQEDYSSGKRMPEKLALLRTFFRLGIRSIHLTHNGRNELGDGGNEEDGGRLSRFGVAVLKEAQHLGMNVSLAHLTDSCIAHALEVAEKPVTATHDNARAVYPHPRNFTDDQLRAMARNGGVVGIHFLRMMCNPQRLLLDDYLDHMAHVAQIAGHDHVGIGWLGSDAGFREFAGSHSNSFLAAPGGEPLEMKEAYDVLVERLAARGFSDAQIGAFTGGNYLRVLREVLPARGA
jgi:membrane dipeptidase